MGLRLWNNFYKLRNSLGSSFYDDYEFELAQLYKIITFHKERTYREVEKNVSFHKKIHKKTWKKLELENA